MDIQSTSYTPEEQNPLHHEDLLISLCHNDHPKPAPQPPQTAPADLNEDQTSAIKKILLQNCIYSVQSMNNQISDHLIQKCEEDPEFAEKLSASAGTLDDCLKHWIPQKISEYLYKQKTNHFITEPVKIPESFILESAELYFTQTHPTDKCFNPMQTADKPAPAADPVPEQKQKKERKKRTTKPKTAAPAPIAVKETPPAEPSEKPAKSVKSTPSKRRKKVQPTEPIVSLSQLWAS